MRCLSGGYQQSGIVTLPPNSRARGLAVELLCWIFALTKYRLWHSRDRRRKPWAELAVGCGGLRARWPAAGTWQASGPAPRLYSTGVERPIARLRKTKWNINMVSGGPSGAQSRASSTHTLGTAL